jgi:hypothetical protein
MFIEPLSDGLGKVLARGPTVMDDRNRLVAPFLRKKIRGERRHLIVAATQAEHVRAALVRQFRVGRAGRHVEDAGFFVRLGCRNRRMRAGMSHDEDHAVSHHLAGGGYRLIGITGIIGPDNADRLTEDAACLVHLGGC